MSDSKLTDETIYPLSALPPLGIGRLLLWTACSAVMLTANLALNRIIEERLETSLGLEKFFVSVRAITDGPSLAALLIWLDRKRRGIRFPVQPGEWLLVLGGISVVVVLLTLAAWCQLPLEQTNPIFAIPCGLMAGGCLIVALWPPLPKWWRFAILAMSGMWGVELAQILLLNFLQDLPVSAYELIGNLYFAALIIPVVVLIVCIAIDRKRHIQRGWMHWTGVAICIATLLLSIARHAYYSWIRA